MQKPLNTQLPADLPENWQLDQAVSPEGTDVGLTEKHGYNYLSKQINEAQKAINTVNETFANVQGNLETITTDTSIADSDTVPVVKSDNTKRKVSFTNIVNAIKAKFNSVYAALVHSHGNITNDGKIGSTANLAVFTETDGKLKAGTLPVAAGGTGASTAAGARTNLGVTPANIGAAPTTHNHTKNQITDFPDTMPPSAHTHPISDISSGILPIAKGGTGAGSATEAREALGITVTNLGAAPATHSHTKNQITDFPSTMPPSAHNHSADNITSGTLPITRGGTGAVTAPDANKNLTKRVMNTAPAEDLPRSYPEGIFIYVETAPNSALPYKPSEFGLLLSIKSEAEVSQFWFTQPNGTIYRRGGNTAGWNASQAVPTNRGWVPVGSGTGAMATAELQ